MFKHLLLCCRPGDFVYVNLRTEGKDVHDKGTPNVFNNMDIEFSDEIKVC